MAADTVVHSVIVNELLSEDNYEHWRVRVKTYLLAKGLWNLVRGNATEPSRGKAKKEAWKKINAEALHAIHICCRNHAFSLIQDIRSAKEAWDTLKQNLRKNNVDDFSSDGENKKKKEFETGDAEKDKEAVQGHLPSDDAQPEKENGIGANEPQKDVEIDVVEGDENNNGNDKTNYGTLFEDLNNKKWDAVLKFIELHPEAAREKDPSDGKTVLHHAGNAEELEIVKKLLPLMREEDLEILDDENYTALDCCPPLQDTDANVEITKCLVEKNKKPLTLVHPDWDIPLLQAYINGRPKMANYLYSVTPLVSNDPNAADLISLSFRTKRFGIAWDLIQREPRLAVAENTFSIYKFPFERIGMYMLCTLKWSPAQLLGKMDLQLF